MIFDNSKLKRLVPGFTCTTPFARGAEEIMAWYDEDPSRQKVNEHVDQMMDTLIEKYESIWP